MIDSIYAVGRQKFYFFSFVQSYESISMCDCNFVIAKARNIAFKCLVVYSSFCFESLLASLFTQIPLYKFLHVCTNKTF